MKRDISISRDDRSEEILQMTESAVIHCSDAGGCRPAQFAAGSDAGDDPWGLHVRAVGHVAVEVL